MHPDFPVQATETIQNQRTAVDSDNDNCQDNCLTEPETHNLAKKNMHKQPNNDARERGNQHNKAAPVPKLSQGDTPPLDADPQTCRNKNTTKAGPNKTSRNSVNDRRHPKRTNKTIAAMSQNKNTAKKETTGDKTNKAEGTKLVANALPKFKPPE